MVFHQILALVATLQNDICCGIVQRLSVYKTMDSCSLKQPGAIIGIGCFQSNENELQDNNMKQKLTRGKQIFVNDEPLLVANVKCGGAGIL